MPYKYAWAVKDDYTYNDYAHETTADDKGYVTGSYRVLLPDGRTQIVTYKADDYSGYVADVKYEGTWIIFFLLNLPYEEMILICVFYRRGQVPRIQARCLPQARLPR